MRYLILAGLLYFQALLPLRERVHAAQIAEYFGCCDASAGVFLDDRHFAVANDEDNVIRIYQTGRFDGPVGSLDLSPFLDLDKDHPETDIEAAARQGDWVYWITSHGRNKDGKKRESRQRFFATRIVLTGEVPDLAPFGTYSDDFIKRFDDLGELKGIGIKEAARIAPKERGGLNIEGLSAREGGGLWIGLRNPIPDGKALLIGLQNPEQVIRGQRPVFDRALYLDLQGMGVRDMVWDSGGVFILAGPFDGSAFVSPFLFFYRDDGLMKRVDIDLPVSDFNPEVLMSLSGREGRYVLLSDDGGLKVRGKECKDLEAEGERRFRSFELSLNP